MRRRNFRQRMRSYPTFCKDGLPPNSIEACLYVGEIRAIEEFQKKLIAAGAKNIANLEDFSIALFDHVDMSVYEDDQREHILTWIATNDPVTKRQHRVSQHVVREFMAGAKRLGNAYKVRVPSADIFFKISALAGKGNGKSTVALPLQNGNLVPRVVAI